MKIKMVDSVDELIIIKLTKDAKESPNDFVSIYGSKVSSC